MLRFTSFKDLQRTLLSLPTTCSCPSAFSPTFLSRTSGAEDQVMGDHDNLPLFLFFPFLRSPPLRNRLLWQKVWFTRWASFFVLWQSVVELIVQDESYSDGLERQGHGEGQDKRQDKRQGNRVGIEFEKAFFSRHRVSYRGVEERVISVIEVEPVKTAKKSPHPHSQFPLFSMTTKRLPLSPLPSFCMA